MLSALLDRRNSYLKWAIGTVTGTAEHMVAKWFGHLMAVGVPDPAAPGVSFFSRHYRDLLGVEAGSDTQRTFGTSLSHSCTTTSAHSPLRSNTNTHVPSLHAARGDIDAIQHVYEKYFMLLHILYPAPFSEPVRTTWAKIINESWTGALYGQVDRNLISVRILDILNYVVDTVSTQIGLVTSTRLTELVDDTVGRDGSATPFGGGAAGPASPSPQDKKFSPHPCMFFADMPPDLLAKYMLTDAAGDHATHWIACPVYWRSKAAGVQDSLSLGELSRAGLATRSTVRLLP